MIVWVILGDLFALMFFNFHFKEAALFFTIPFGGLTVAVLGLAFRETSNELIWVVVALSWLLVLLLPLLSKRIRNHPVATVRFQRAYAFLQFLFGVIGIIGSSC